MSISVAKAFLHAAAKKPKQAATVKSVNPITKLAHVRFDLSKVLTPENLPLLKQNVRNRNAQSYADPERVYALHQ